MWKESELAPAEIVTRYRRNCFCASAAYRRAGFSSSICHRLGRRGSRAGLVSRRRAIRLPSDDFLGGEEKDRRRSRDDERVDERVKTSDTVPLVIRDGH